MCLRHIAHVSDRRSSSRQHIAKGLCWVLTLVAPNFVSGPRFTLLEIHNGLETVW